MAIFELATCSRELFFFCVDECNSCYRSGDDLSLYRKVIALHREDGDLEKLFNRTDFIHLIHRTLEAWNMNQRAAKLSGLEELEKTITQNRTALLKLYKHKLHELTEKTVDEIIPALELVFTGLRVMKSKRRIVGVSKTLHFLLPDLIIPIDSSYTMPAFFNHNKFSTDPEIETRDFIHIFKNTLRIVKQLNLTLADVSGKGWNTSVPKLIDNAIIGVFKLGSDKLKEKIKSLQI
jgi:hypothetical protein